MSVTTSIAAHASKRHFMGVHLHKATAGNSFYIGLFKGTTGRVYDRDFDGTSTNCIYTDITAATNDEASVTNGTGYTAKGLALTNADPVVSGTTAYCDYTNADGTLQWTLTETTATVSLASEGAFIFDESTTSPVDGIVSFHSFGSTVTASGNGATFTVNIPAAGATTAILRYA